MEIPQGLWIFRKYVISIYAQYFNFLDKLGEKINRKRLMGLLKFATLETKDRFSITFSCALFW